MFKRGDTVVYTPNGRELTGRVGIVLGPSSDYKYQKSVRVRWWHALDVVQLIHPANLRLVKGDQNV